LNETVAYDVLNRLLVILYRSLAMYLRGARPWTHRGDEAACGVLDDVAADQARTVEILTDLLLDRRAPIDLGEFPLEFTSVHDLSLDYLVARLIDDQRYTIDAIEQCAAATRAGSAERAVAEEALGAARAHLQSLEELAAASSDAVQSAAPTA
jgi:hypothetical protein